MAILAGLRLGPYEILSAIGAGGMGEVYRGGLLSGSAIATKDLRPEACVVGCEPRNADDTARSVAAGHIEPAAKTRTIADGLRATLAPRTFAILRRLVNQFVLVSEEEIVEAHAAAVGARSWS